MATSAISRGNLIFPPYSHQRKQTNLNTGRYPGQSVYGLQSGFGTDEFATSPDTPTYLDFTNAYQLPANNDWLTWGKDPVLTEAQVFPSAEPENDTIAEPLNLSPAVDPLELSNTMPDVAAFGQDLFDESSDMFYSTPSPTQEEFGMPSQTITVDTQSPSTSRTSEGSRRSRKRKSSSSDYVDSPARSSESPDPQNDATAPRTRRRRSGTGLGGPKKTAHNMVEKRYRTNLNDKIASLRDAVPSLRIMVHRLEHQSSDDGDEEMEQQEDEEDLCGLMPAHKLNKATILSKATEYISHLERKNKGLAKENAALRSRVQGLGGVLGKTNEGTRWS